MSYFRGYKFRPLDTPEHEQRLEEILNGQLWCADWRSLNDPMEGMFVSSRDRELIDSIIDFKQGFRVCSLAGAWKAVPLWAYYAGGFSGVAVEVALPRLDAPGLERLFRQEELISPVEYRPEWAFRDRGDCGPEEAARRVLLSKHSHWKHEQEIRVLTRSHYFRPEAVLRVLFGPRIDEHSKFRIEQLCERLGIECANVQVSSRGLTLRQRSTGSRYWRDSWLERPI